MKAQIIKQHIGIDISKSDFKACLSVLTHSLDVKVKASRSFSNTSLGFASFFNWFSSKEQQGIPLGFTMEATGVYYESLAYYLYGRDFKVHVVLPNQAKKYGQSLGVRSKTDQMDAALLARTGLERNLPPWRPLSPQLHPLKQLCRKRIGSLQREQ